MIKVEISGETTKEVFEQMRDMVAGMGVPVGQADVSQDIQVEVSPVAEDQVTADDLVNSSDKPASKPTKKAAKKKTATTRKAKKVEDDAVEEADAAEPAEGRPDVTENNTNEADHKEALSILLDVYQNGDKEGVIDLLKTYGVGKFTDIPVDQGTKLLQQAETLAGV